MNSAVNGDVRPEPSPSGGTPGGNSNTPQASGMDRIREMMKGNTLLPLLIAGAAAIALMVAMFMWASSPSYQTLYSNLSEADGGRIINELDARGVPYQFGQNGQNIMVPSEQVHILRLQLAEQGLPQGGNVGFELMDSQAFGISQFAEQVNYQRSLEGELTRSIESMNPVSLARIHLSMAKPSVFIRDREPAKASVVLTLHPGRTLGDSQVEAIRHLVSSSVPELSPDNVTVVDHAGNLLSSKGGNGLDGEELGYTQEVERRYQARIEDILTPLFGKQNVRIQVAAQMDFSVREETVERYGPNQDTDAAAIRSTQSSGSLNGSEALARGIPGALSNTPPGWLPSPIEQNQEAAEANAPEGEAAATPAAQTPQSNLRYDNVVNYEVDRNITHVQHQQGQVQRLSVAAVVNYRNGVDEEGNAIQIPLTEQEMAQVSRLVQQAMGFSQARGDALEVVNSPFTEVEEAPIQREWWTDPDIQKLILSLSRYVLAALLALSLYLLILRPLMRRHLAVPAAVAPVAAADAAVGQSTTEGTVITAESGAEGAFAGTKRKRERKASNYEEDLKDVRQIAKDDPRLISMVVRSWMNQNG